MLEILQNRDVYINLEFKTNKIHNIGIESIVLALVKNCQRIDKKQQYCFLMKVPVLFPEYFVKKNHFAAIHPHFYLPSKVTQRIWTVDNPKLARRYFKLGVAGIFTNNFELMNKVKKEIR